MNLPDGINEINGYHLSCYKKFVALSKKQRGIMNAKKNSDGADNTDDSHADNTRTTKSELAATRTTKGTGVFNCFVSNNEKECKMVNVETPKF